VLTRIEQHQFKSFRDAELSLGRLTFLVGANASGKSNLFDALRFLQGIGLDLPIADVLRGRYEGQREVWPGIRGNGAEVARGGACSRGGSTEPHFRISTTWSLAGWTRASHEIEVHTQPDMVAQEMLTAQGHGKHLFATGEGGVSAAGLVVVSAKSTGNRRNLIRHFSAATSVLSGIERARDRAAPSVLDCARAVRKAMSGLTFVSISPSRMRDYVPAHLPVLGSSGENISAVLARLCKDKDERRSFVDWLTELCGPEVADIDFIETRLGDVMLQLVEAGGTKVSARSLSDGTLRFLGHLVAIKTAPEGSILLLEEIENGLHPSRIDLLTGLLETTTAARGIQVIATTHSPAVLRALSPQALADAVLFARRLDDPGAGTVARRLGDLDGFAELAERRGIEHLFTTQWLERAL
jgi:predicted ATPase